MHYIIVIMPWTQFLTIDIVNGIIKKIIF